MKHCLQLFLLLATQLDVNLRQSISRSISYLLDGQELVATSDVFLAIRGVKTTDGLQISEHCNPCEVLSGTQTFLIRATGHIVNVAVVSEIQT
jgi:hypothetical protein